MLALTLAATGGGAIQDLAIVLAVAGIAVLAMGRFGVAAIPAFLIAGAISGPYALGLIGSPDTLATISELAIILLLFGIGLHLDLGEIRSGSAWMFLAAAVAVVATTLALWPIAMLFGLTWAPAFAVACAMGLSSTALVTRRLMKQRALRLPAGRLSVIVLIGQDLAVPLMLVLIGLIARIYNPAPEPISLPAMLASAALSLVGLVGLAFAGRLILPRLLRQAAAIGSDEVLLTLGLASAIGCALITQLLGFSYELGAFLAGLLLGSTPFRLQLGALLSPARDFFLAVFFTTLGMAINPAALTDIWWIVILATVVLMAFKAVVITVSCWASGATGPVATASGLTLAQAGEFSLVLIQAAAATALLSPTATSGAVAVVVISLIVAPVPILAASRLERFATRVPRAPWLRTARTGTGAKAASLDDDAAPNRRVIIAGFGPVGQVAAEALEWMDVDITVVELNPKTVHTHSALGRSVVFGDVSREEVLHAAGIESADAIIITIPDERAVMRACQHAKHINPDVRVIARFPFLGKGLLAKSMGADEIVVDEVATATAMQQLVAEYLRIKPEEQPPPDPDAIAPGLSPQQGA